MPAMMILKIVENGRKFVARNAGAAETNATRYTRIKLVQLSSALYLDFDMYAP